MVKLSHDRLSVLSAYDNRVLLELNKAQLLIDQRFREEQELSGPEAIVDPELNLYCNVSLNFVKFVLLGSHKVAKTAQQVLTTPSDQEIALMTQFEAAKLLADESLYRLPSWLVKYKHLNRPSCWPMSPQEEFTLITKVRESGGKFNDYRLMALPNELQKLHTGNHKLFLNEYEAYAMTKRMEKDTGHDLIYLLNSLQRTYANIDHQFVTCALSNCDRCRQNTVKDPTLLSMLETNASLLSGSSLICTTTFENSPSSYSSALPSESSLLTDSKDETEEEFPDDSSVAEIDDKSVDEPFKSLTPNDLHNLPKSLKKYLLKTEQACTQWNKSYLKLISLIQHNAFTSQIYCRSAMMLTGQEGDIMRNVRCMLPLSYELAEKSLLEALGLKKEEMFWTRERETFIMSVFNLSTDQVPEPVPEQYCNVLPNSYRLAKLRGAPSISKLVFHYDNRLVVNNLELIELIKYRDEHHKHPGMEETYQVVKELYHNANRKIVRLVKAACEVCCSKFFVIREARNPSLTSKLSDGQCYFPRYLFLI
ncbi:hypothetical protein Ciccas_001375 [Cichlidogyrus casuarinus]|uniref:Integrase zinc-binding domain-containing protein n=1 Tax=Cichlidogyrus casuarinus TaxID=1844966 RepID=A0ABD2QKR6_9PLAT